MSPRFTLVLVLAFLFGGALVLLLRPEPAPPKPAAEAPVAPQALVLAASWEPAFCETAPGKPECRSLGNKRFDASHFALHGLWPEGEYCGVSATLEQRDRDGQWSNLPPVELSPAARAALEEAMPGTRSQLERHEWLKHGSCFGTDAEAYFGAATQLLAALNTSAVRELFANSVGRKLTAKAIRASFDTAFGADAGLRVEVNCNDDDGRRIVTELQISLSGTIGPSPSLGRLIVGATPTGPGCASGVIDPVGAQ